VEETPNRSEWIAEGRALVRSLALRTFRSLPIRVDLDDLIAYGELGLAEAARDFDPEQGNQFSTFAYYRIRGAIYDGLAKMTWTSRARYRRMRYEQMANQVLEDSSDSAETDPATWFSRTTESLAVVYLASGMDSETDPMSQVADRGDEPVERIMHLEVSEKLRDLVKKLPPSESRLIQMVYFEGYSLQDASRNLGFSKSWGSRLHAKVLDDLARSMRSVGMHD
jgi:RNA polymerase sigma factor for flagellar operon FliA